MPWIVKKVKVRHRSRKERYGALMSDMLKLLLVSSAVIFLAYLGWTFSHQPIRIEVQNDPVVIPMSQPENNTAPNFYPNSHRFSY